MRLYLAFAALLAAGAPPGPTYALFKSMDGGATWARADAGLPPSARINALTFIEAPAGPTAIAATDAGIFISLDRAVRWRSAYPSGRVLALATAGDTVFAATDRAGLLHSRDQGRTWSRLDNSPAAFIRSLLLYQGGLIAGTDSKGIYLSSNQGLSWTAISDGLPPGAQAFSLATVSGRLFAGLYARGLFAWNPELNRWSRVSTVTPLALATAGPALIAGHNPGGIHRSGDLGATWQPAQSIDRALQPGDPVWELASDGKELWAGAASGIFHSADLGVTWKRVREGLPDSSPGIAFHANGRFVLAATILPAK